jgi:hypothetical protein
MGLFQESCGGGNAVYSVGREAVGPRDQEGRRKSGGTGLSGRRVRGAESMGEERSCLSAGKSGREGLGEYMEARKAERAPYHGD